MNAALALLGLALAQQLAPSVTTAPPSDDGWRILDRVELIVNEGADGGIATCQEDVIAVELGLEEVELAACGSGGRAELGSVVGLGAEDGDSHRGRVAAPAR